MRSVQGVRWRGLPQRRIRRRRWEPLHATFLELAKDPAKEHPPSPVIKEIRWAPPETIVRLAKGSDNWPITGATTICLYTAYGDGSGFEPLVTEKLSLGLAALRGNPPDMVGENLRAAIAGNERRRAARQEGQRYVDGRRHALSLGTQRRQTRNLAWSADRGVTWTWADWKLTTSFGCPTFLNFGPNYDGRT